MTGSRQMIVVLIFLHPLAPVRGGEPCRLTEAEFPLRYREYEFALEKADGGPPRLDWERFRERPARVVRRDEYAVVLENGHFRATLLPAMGRLISFVDKPSGREQLWINPAAIPIPAHNDTGFWVTWGGIEHVLPRGEHGTSHALTWDHAIEEAGEGRKAVRMRSVEPLTGLRHTVVYTAYADRRCLEATITVENPTREPVRFSHWTTALLAPGGRGQVTPRTELVVPAERFVAADKPFNAWMRGRLGGARTSPLRFVENWEDIGDLMATPLQRPFYAAYCHEEDQAVVRSFDPAVTPGFDIWTWGYPPDRLRQAEYTAGPPNLGYVEFWSGTAKDFTDEARGVLGPGESISWTERLGTAAGLRGAEHLEAALEAACR